MDLYHVLGVARDAGPDEIRRAYRRLAIKLHPDRNSAPDAEERFKALGKAYEVLSDEKKRALYDRYGDDWEAAAATSGHAQGGGPESGFHWTGPQTDFEWGGGDAAGIEELLRSVFGEGWATNGGSSNGATRDSWTGADWKRAARTGTGSTDTGWTGSGPRRPVGAEFEITLPLRDALVGGVRTFRVGEGSGSEEIRLPAGIPDGARLRFGPNRLRVRVLLPQGYEARGRDLIRDLPVAPWEAVLGGPIEFTHADGRTLRVTLPKGSTNGREVRLRGLAFSGAKGRRGDLILRVRIEVPKEPTPADVEEASRWQKRSSFRPER